MLIKDSKLRAQLRRKVSLLICSLLDRAVCHQHEGGNGDALSHLHAPVNHIITFISNQKLRLNFIHCNINDYQLRVRVKSAPSRLKSQHSSFLFHTFKSMLILFINTFICKTQTGYQTSFLLTYTIIYRLFIFIMITFLRNGHMRKEPPYAASLIMPSQPMKDNTI